MKTILVVVGTRPEAIKLAPVILALKKHPTHFTVQVCSTAQHRHILDSVLNLLHINPDIDLDLMQNNQSIPELSSRAMVSLTQTFKQVMPDLVLVQGDTTTAMIAAMAAFYQQIPIAHVEAGLRTKNILTPFPEEMNRRVISILGEFHFAPTSRAVDSLVGEGIAKEKIYLTGNTVVDALLTILEQGVDGELPVQGEDQKIIIVTAHRRESFGDALKEICKAVRELARRFLDLAFIYPVHPNPNVQEVVKRELIGIPRVFLLDPLDYRKFVFLMKHSYLILTDSGGIQEEAASLGKPVLVMRGETERVESIEIGVSKLVGVSAERIVQEVETLLLDERAYAAMSQHSQVYGDGHASERIIKVLEEHL